MMSPRDSISRAIKAHNFTCSSQKCRPPREAVAGCIAISPGISSASRLPALATVAAIPILVHRLGAERFGVLTLAWMIAGYFGLFDFGLGRALTQAMAQEWNLGAGARAATMFWTVLAMMLAFSALAALVLVMLAPWLVGSALRIPPALRRETLLRLVPRRERIAGADQRLGVARRFERGRSLRSAQPDSHADRSHVIRRAGVDTTLHPQPRVADWRADSEPRTFVDRFTLEWFAMRCPSCAGTSESTRSA